MFFQSDETQNIIRYIKETYNHEPQFLWEKFPCNAVFRHKYNKKWYAVLINLSKRKLGIEKDGATNILVVKCDPLLTGSLIDGEKYFPAYHMNKEHWITIVIDKTTIDEITHMIDMSYEITKKK